MRGFSRATLVLFSILFISDELQKYSKVDAYRAWAQKYTKSSTGCSCWFDLSRGLNCACCQNKGIQCGFPLHKYCQRDARRPQFRKGCPGNLISRMRQMMWSLFNMKFNKEQNKRFVYYYSV